MGGSYELVEVRGIEPLAPCVQSRCSPSELHPHGITRKKRNAPIDYSKGRLERPKARCPVSATLWALHRGNLFQVEAVLFDDRIRQELVAYPRHNVLSP